MFEIIILATSQFTHSFSRVFYLIDLECPVKKEILLHSADLLNPSQYLPSRLHSDLAPSFTNISLCNGVYKIVGPKKGNIGVYAYSFTSTESASRATSDSVSMSNIPEKSSTIQSIFQFSQPVFKLSAFIVPTYFIADSDCDSLVSKSKQEGRQELDAELLLDFGPTVPDLVTRLKQYDSPPGASNLPPLTGSTSGASSLTPSTLSVAKCKGNEDIRNERLVLWLREQLDEERFFISSDEKSSHTLSRHSRSEEDFLWYVRPGTSEILQGVCATSDPVVEEDSDSDSSYVEHYDEIQGCAGECKMESATHDSKFQLMANMNKTAGDLANDALKQRVIFNKIIVYGLLVGYREKKITKAYKMVMDFKAKKSSLEVVEEANLDIATGFSMATTMIAQKVNEITK